MDFNTVAQRYDRVNWFISLGQAGLWQRRFAKLIAKNASPKTDLLLEIGAGTGSTALRVIRQLAKALPSGNLTCDLVDSSPAMLEIAKRRKFELPVNFELNDLLDLPERGAYNLIYSAFTVRNFKDPFAGLRKMARLLSPGGLLAIMEFSQPRAAVRPFAHWFERVILWRLAVLAGGNKSDYEYLARSVLKWYSAKDFGYMLQNLGLSEVQTKRIFFGVVAIHIYKKPQTTDPNQLAKPLRQARVFG